MRRNNSASSVEISGLFETNDFGIIESENTYELLQGKQYVNPWRSTLRALVENAFDAHKEAGTTSTVRIEVKSGSVTVEDKGLGISPDTMAQYYTKFFASSRTQSNDYHGGFGVGSKAPFSVVSKFYVKTHHAGVCYIWDLQKEKNEKPTATLRHQEPSSEQGTYVSLTYVDALTQSNGRSLSYNTLAKDIAIYAEELKGAQPESITLHNTVGPTQYTTSTSPSPQVIVGQMPYDLLPEHILKLPSHYYNRTPFWKDQVQTSLPKPRGSNFGKKTKVSPAASDPMPASSKVTLWHTEPLSITLPIGSVEPHFSKERLAHTPQNIQTLSTAYKKAWLAHNWDVAVKQADPTSDHGKLNWGWRLHMDDALELKAQGKDVNILAWATRPLELQGQVANLKKGPLCVRMNQQYTMSNTWQTTNHSLPHWQEIKDWAATWNIEVTHSLVTKTCVLEPYHGLIPTVLDGQLTLSSYTHPVDDLPTTELLIINANEPHWQNLSRAERDALLLTICPKEMVITSLPTDEIKRRYPLSKTLLESWEDHWRRHGKEDVLGLIHVNVIVPDLNINESLAQKFRTLSKTTSTRTKGQQSPVQLLNIAEHLKGLVVIHNSNETCSNLVTQNPLLSYIAPDKITPALYQHILALA